MWWIGERSFGFEVDKGKIRHPATSSRTQVSFNPLGRNIQAKVGPPSILFDKLEDIEKATDKDEFPELLEHYESLNEAAESDEDGKGRREKDPNAPKRPANAFFMYCQLMRDQIRDELAGEATLSNRTKLLGQKWKAMTNEEKKVLCHSWFKIYPAC